MRTGVDNIQRSGNLNFYPRRTRTTSELHEQVWEKLRKENLKKRMLSEVHPICESIYTDWWKDQK